MSTNYKGCIPYHITACRWMQASILPPASIRARAQYPSHADTAIGFELHYPSTIAACIHPTPSCLHPLLPTSIASVGSCCPASCPHVFHVFTPSRLLHPLPMLDATPSSRPSLASIAHVPILPAPGCFLSAAVGTAASLVSIRPPSHVHCPYRIPHPLGLAALPPSSHLAFVHPLPVHGPSSIGHSCAVPAARPPVPCAPIPPLPPCAI
ncbi:hypothetical protein BJ912DRAFT_1065939 [Pholiota molesta]|nr:hypothetical protein BJ912DRAFT_1065939 [Pholiota molesta]